MNKPFDFSRADVLHIVQSMARPLRGGHAGDAALFADIVNLDDFSPGQIAALADAVISFFLLDDVPSIRSELASLRSLEDWAALAHGAWAMEAVCFHSSGSTGAPVGHVQPMDIMAEEMAALEPFFATRRRIVSVAPAHHVYGFMFGPQMGNWLKLPVLYAPPLPLAGFFDALRSGDIIVGFPLFWNALLSVIRREDNALCLPPNVIGFTATAPCPVELIHDLLSPKNAGKGAPLAAMGEIYGSTETMAMGFRRDGTEWFDLLPLWELCDLPEGTNGAHGIRRVRGDGSRGEIRPFPDVVLWNEENPRKFRPERRTDKAVQVGGINVYPEKVAAAIRTHPHVRDCAVRLMRPEEGTRLKAFIVSDLPPAEAAAFFGRPFRDWLAENLATAERPKRIRLGGELPRNSMGKSADWD